MMLSCDAIDAAVRLELTPADSNACGGNKEEESDASRHQWLHCRCAALSAAASPETRATLQRPKSHRLNIASHLPPCLPNTYTAYTDSFVF